MKAVHKPIANADDLMQALKLPSRLNGPFVLANAFLSLIPPQIWCPLQWSAVGIARQVSQGKNLKSILLSCITAMHC